MLSNLDPIDQKLLAQSHEYQVEIIYCHHKLATTAIKLQINSINLLYYFPIA